MVTNNHVVDNATTIKVQLSDGRKFDAKVVGKDPRSDICLLYTSAEQGMAGSLHRLGHRPDWRAAAAVAAAAAAQHQRPGDERRR